MATALEPTKKTKDMKRKKTSLQVDKKEERKRERKKDDNNIPVIENEKGKNTRFFSQQHYIEINRS